MAYRATPRTEERKAATRERIASAALEQVAEGGYASAGVQAVAQRAGVAVGTVYRHFPSKAELFAEVFRRASQRELDVLAEVAEPDGRAPSERCAAGVEAFCRRALAGPVLAYALIAEPVDPAVESERLRLRRGYRDVFAAVLAEGVEAGELEPHDTSTVAAALVGGLGEALVGPLAAGRRVPSNPRTQGRSLGTTKASPEDAGGRRRSSSSEALIATLVSFSLNALPRKERTRDGARPQHA